MPETKHLLKVFLCHAHADRDAVHALYARLTNDGVDAWLDKEKLLPGQDWEYEIRKAVREVDVVVVCLSKQFNQAGFRQKEVRLALDTAMNQPDGEIFIIPARLEECDTLESLRRWHWVDLFEDDGYERLMRALRSRADKIGAALQGKRIWLPKVTTPHKKPIDEQTPVEVKSVLARSEEENREAVKSKPEKPELQNAQRKPNTAITVALIGFAGTIIAGLLGSPLIEKWFSSMPVPTNSATAAESIVFTTEPGLTSTEVFVSQALFTPSATSTETATASPTETLTPSITPTGTLLTNTPEAPASGFVLISIDKVAYIGGKAKAKIRTQPGVQCSLVFYLPSGVTSKAPGVGNIIADQDGYCAWSWSILGNVNPGYGTAVLIAGGQTTNYYIKLE